MIDNCKSEIRNWNSAGIPEIQSEIQKLKTKNGMQFQNSGIEYRIELNSKNCTEN